MNNTQFANRLQNSTHGHRHTVPSIGGKAYHVHADREKFTTKRNMSKA